MSDLVKIRDKINKIKTERFVLRKHIRREKEDLAEIINSLEASKEAQKIAQSCALLIQKKAHDQIASVVSKCLEIVFDEPYLFKINFEQKRGRTEAVLVFERNGHEVDPLTSSGGGVVDVAAFALRLSCLLLHKPKLRKLIVMDEPFKFVSAGYRSNIRSMLSMLSKDYGVQIIMVTHISELEMGKVISLD